MESEDNYFLGVYSEAEGSVPCWSWVNEVIFNIILFVVVYSDAVQAIFFL